MAADVEGRARVDVGTQLHTENVLTHGRSTSIDSAEARIAALERLVGRQALELEFLKGALKHGPRPRSATTSVVTGPAASPSPKDAG